MNCFGEVIGIMFYDSPFLPSNFIISWWNNYKRNRLVDVPLLACLLNT